MRGPIIFTGLAIFSQVASALQAAIASSSQAFDNLKRDLATGAPNATTLDEVNQAAQVMAESSERIEALLNPEKHNLRGSVERQVDEIESKISAQALAQNLREFKIPSIASSQRKASPESQPRAPDYETISTAIHEYPAVSGVQGPVFNLATHSAVLFKNVESAEVCFGDPNSANWIKLKFNSNAKRINSAAERAKYSVPDHIVMPFLGVTIETSDQPGKLKWWSSYNFFLYDNMRATKNGYLALNMHYLKSGQQDNNGVRFPEDHYSMTAPLMIEQSSGYQYMPSLCSEVGYTDKNSAFPWIGVNGGWMGFFDNGSTFIRKELIQKLGNKVSFKANGSQASIQVYRSLAEQNIPVPGITTQRPSTGFPTKNPTVRPTNQPTTYPTRRGDTQQPTPNPTKRNNRG